MYTTDIVTQLKKELVYLPGESAHLEMSPAGREKSSEALKKVKDARQSAVSIILFEEQEELHFVLIQRSEYEGIHSKQISFPGGKKERYDTNFIATALRETHEEVGIHIDQLHHLGKLTKVYIPVSNFEVHPHVFYMKRKQDFKKQVREVDEIFTVPISALLDNKNLHKKDIRVNKNYLLKKVPCFIFEAKIVWGATAIILNELKSVLNRF